MKRFALLCVVAWAASLAAAEELPVVSKVAQQPLGVQVKQLVEALEFIGAPLPRADREALAAADGDAAKVQAVLDKHCIAGVEINPESRVKVAAGPAKHELVEGGWRAFLVKVSNQAGVTAELKAVSPQARPLHNAPQNEVNDRWLDLTMFNARPMNQNLSGLELEYRIVQLYSRDAGKRSATIAFNVGQGTQDIGFRNDVTMTFEARPAIPLTFRVLDEAGKPTTCAIVLRDGAGRVYPSQTKRLAPDFSFHPQVYRADGEMLRVPVGRYSVEATRGPEYRAVKKSVEVKEDGTTAEIKLERWIDPVKFGYWSGDHHIHAAGCAHYTKPTEGVHAPDMMRHCLGEDLKVGANLTWGPCFDYQKQFFTGVIDKVSTYPYLLRYDVEVSGFGSHRSGHLCLLRLKEQMYPGGNSDKHWPTLCLNTLKWAKRQGALVGPAHSGWGLAVKGTELPNYEVPPFDGIGANEYIVDVTHEVDGPYGVKVPAVDFISTVDTPYTWELNIWYHTLNCGYRTRISGETDFPCIYGERVGLGRSYVKLDGKLDYDAWCEAIRVGRNYVGDGRSHIIDMKVDDVEMGSNGSELKLAAAKDVKVTAKVAVLLDEQPRTFMQTLRPDEKPYWHVERARLPGTSDVKVELVVNGKRLRRRTWRATGRCATSRST
jgi:hypothetical protein